MASSGTASRLILIALLLIAHRTLVAADTPLTGEYQAKARLLYNIPKFVKWPTDSFANASSPLVIGVLGQSPVADELWALVKVRLINGRRILVKRLETAEEARTSHVLFVSGKENARFAAMYTILESRPVLTIGESGAFIAAGGTIRFVQTGDKLDLEINMISAQRAHLTISSQLQKLVTVSSRAP